MIITCREDYRNSLIKGKDYLVIEIYINIPSQRISFRTVSEEGILAIYNHNLFEIKNASLNNYSVKINQLNIQIMLTNLLELDQKSSNIDRLWGDYFDGNIDMIKKVHEIISQYAKNENIIISNLVAY